MHADLPDPFAVLARAPRDNDVRADVIYGCVDWYFYEPPPLQPCGAPRAEEPASRAGDFGPGV